MERQRRKTFPPRYGVEFALRCRLEGPVVKEDFQQALFQVPGV